MSTSNVGMYFMRLSVRREINIIKGLMCLEVCVSVDK